MKKLMFVLTMLLMVQGTGFAAQRGTAEYEALKAYKHKQSDEKKTRKAQPSSNAKGFWQREAERSGLAGTGAMFSNAISLNKSNSNK